MESSTMASAPFITISMPRCMAVPASLDSFPLADQAALIAAALIPNHLELGQFFDFIIFGMTTSGSKCGKNWWRKVVIEQIPLDEPFTVYMCVGSSKCMRLSRGCLCFNARVIQGCNGVPPVKGAIVYGSLLGFMYGLLYTKPPQFTFYTVHGLYS